MSEGTVNTGRLLCTGEMLIDFTPVKGMSNTYTANPGGAPANVAVSAARNGIKAGFLGKMGNDDFGKLLVNTLKKDNVEILVPELTDKANTTLAFVTLSEDGDRSFTFVRKPGADLLLSPEDAEKVDFSKWDMIHAGSVSQSGTPERDAVLLVLKKAKEAGKLVSFDINYRDKIWGIADCANEVEKLIDLVDLLKISDEELSFVGGEENIPQYIKEHGITVIVLTRGGEGATVFLKNTDGIITKTDIPSVKIAVTDTTGAGDAYWGGFLSSLLRQGIRSVSDITVEKAELAGRYGAVSGALCVAKPGGIPALPYIGEIEEMLKK